MGRIRSGRPTARSAARGISSGGPRLRAPECPPRKPIDELGRVLGMTPAVLAAVRPHLTLFGPPERTRWSADPIVAAALSQIRQVAPIGRAGKSGAGRSAYRADDCERVRTEQCSRFSARPSFASGPRCRADTPSSPGVATRLKRLRLFRSGLRSSWRYWFPVQPARANKDRIRVRRAGSDYGRRKARPKGLQAPFLPSCRVLSNWRP